MFRWKTPKRTIGINYLLSSYLLTTMAYMYMANDSCRTLLAYRTEIKWHPFQSNQWNGIFNSINVSHYPHYGYNRLPIHTHFVFGSPVDISEKIEWNWYSSAIMNIQYIVYINLQFQLCVNEIARSHSSSLWLDIFVWTWYLRLSRFTLE